MVFPGPLVAAEGDFGCLLCHHPPFAVEDANIKGERLESAFKSCHLCLYADICRIAVQTVGCGNDAKRMTSEEDFGIGDHQMYVAIESGTSVPAAVEGIACVCLHGYHVVFSPSKQSCHVGLKAEVTIVRLSDRLAVEPHVARVKDSFKVEEDPLALP